jgi:hypothetical protein
MFRHSTVLAPLMLFACLLSLQGFGAERMPPSGGAAVNKTARSHLPDGSARGPTTSPTG